jgi:CBS domain-containing protein
VGVSPWHSIGFLCHLQLGLPPMSPADVVSVLGDSPVLEAFQRMKDKGVGGVAVLDHGTGPIIGNVSARDVCFLLTSPEYFAQRQ